MCVCDDEDGGAMRGAGRERRSVARGAGELLGEQLHVGALDKREVERGRG